MRATVDGIKYEVQWLYEQTFPKSIAERIKIIGHDPVTGTLKFKVKSFIKTYCQVSILDVTPGEEPAEKYTREPLCWGFTQQFPGNKENPPDVFVAKFGRRRALGRALDSGVRGGTITQSQAQGILDRYLCGFPDFLAKELAREEANEAIFQSYLDDLKETVKGGGTIDTAEIKNFKKRLENSTSSTSR